MWALTAILKPGGLLAVFGLEVVEGGGTDGREVIETEVTALTEDDIVGAAFVDLAM